MDWIRSVEDTAYGICNLMPEQLWNLTPLEFQKIAIAKFKLAYPWITRREIETEKEQEPVPDRLKEIERKMNMWVTATKGTE